MNINKNIKHIIYTISITIIVVIVAIIYSMYNNSSKEISNYTQKEAYQHSQFEYADNRGNGKIEIDDIPDIPNYEQQDYTSIKDSLIKAIPNITENKNNKNNIELEYLTKELLKYNCKSVKSFSQEEEFNNIIEYKLIDVNNNIYTFTVDNNFRINYLKKNEKLELGSEFYMYANSSVTVKEFQDTENTKLNAE